MADSESENLVASVAVDVPLPHLDRPFDYLVPTKLREQITVGCRVRVRFAGRLKDGFVLALGHDTEAGIELSSLERVVSSEPVLTPAVSRLIRAVADHYGGTYADVARMAIPPRHAKTESAAPADRPEPTVEPGVGVLARYPRGEEFLDGLEQGRPVRAAWNPVPVAGPPGDWAAGVSDAVQATLASGRGVIVVVPDAESVAGVSETLGSRIGPHALVSLTADLGPARRYRNFLAVLRGHVHVVVGTRQAVFAPVQNLGLIVVWDEGNDLLNEPRAPYHHARDVAAMRTNLEKCGLLITGWSRSAETQALVERGWVVPLQLPPSTVRREAAAVRIAVASDHDLARDPHARGARLPHAVFETVRGALASGPVLFQVPRGGYVTSLACQSCREYAACPSCGRTLRGESRHGSLNAVCDWCGPVTRAWVCPHCGSRQLRAPGVGVARTAEEIGRAFPGTPVVRSWAGNIVDTVPDAPALVLATPGAEPRAAAGYAAAVLLDTQVLLGRASLRAAEEALRRWLNVCSLVRGASEGGTVMAVGESDARALQALVRLDAPGFASRELADRRAAGMPPAAKVVEITGPPPAVADYLRLGGELPGVDAFGPIPVSRDESRLVLRTELSRGTQLVAAVKAESAERVQRKTPGAVRVRVDPVEMG